MFGVSGSFSGSWAVSLIILVGVGPIVGLGVSFFGGVGSGVDCWVGSDFGCGAGFGSGVGSGCDSFLGIGGYIVVTLRHFSFIHRK